MREDPLQLRGVEPALLLVNQAQHLAGLGAGDLGRGFEAGDGQTVVPLFHEIERRERILAQEAPLRPVSLAQEAAVRDRAEQDHVRALLQVAQMAVVRHAAALSLAGTRIEALQPEQDDIGALVASPAHLPDLEELELQSVGAPVRVDLVLRLDQRQRLQERFPLVEAHLERIEVRAGTLRAKDKEQQAERSCDSRGGSPALRKPGSFAGNVG
jgi:hypothetical protein